MKRIFLDTNVVLTGAFSQRGPAGTLSKLANSVQFLHSPLVLEECNNLVSRDAQSTLIYEAAMGQIHSFLTRLGSEVVDNRLPPPGVSAKDRDDELILGAAIAAKADTICTYNIRDFPSKEMAIRTPLSVHRSIAEHTLDHFIQQVELSSKGTVLFFGSIHHASSMGPIIKSGNGTCVTADKEGFIQLSGPKVTRNKVLKPLRAKEEFRLSIRFHQSDFEAALWTKHG
jgi:predicted nucleic acid-binding protein